MTDDRRMIERAALALRDLGRTESAATAELLSRFDDRDAVVSVVASAYSFRLNDGKPQKDDQAARKLAPILWPRHRWVTTPEATEGRWYFYDDDAGRWRYDEGLVELRRAIAAAAIAFANPSNLPPDDDEYKIVLDRAPRTEQRESKAVAARLSTEGGKRAVMAALGIHLRLRADALDSRPDRLALGNWTLYTRGDARGRVQQHRAEHYLTRGLDLDLVTDRSQELAEWHAFGLSILDPDVWKWLNLMLARWALYGEAPPFMIVLHGPTRTGKTTLVETALAVLGVNNLAALGSLVAFAERTQTGPDSAYASLFGPWLVSISEAGRSDVVASPKFKDYTGGGTSNIERKHREQQNAKPTALILLDSNALPIVDGADDAVMRRLWLVPFGRRFYRTDTEAGRAEYDAAVERKESPGVVDPGLGKRLRSRESLEAVLAYWVKLLQQAPDADPTPPLVVQHATEAWRAQANPLAAFIEGRYEFSPPDEVVLSDLADEFRKWLSAALPERAAHYRDNRQVIAALRDLPPRSLSVTRKGRPKVSRVIGLRRVEEAD